MPSSPRPLARSVSVFAKEPLPGRVKTRLARALGDVSSADFYQSLACDTLRCVSELQGVRRLLYFDPPGAAAACAELIPCGQRAGFELRPQSGGDLGSRLAAAFSDLLAPADARALIIGTDCPLVDVEDFSQAFAALDRCDLVLGPTCDGGYYMVGMRRPAPELFRAMPWSTPRVLRETIRRAQAIGMKHRLLRERRDIDTPEDLEPLRREILEAWTDAAAGRRDVFPVNTLRHLSWCLEDRRRGGP